jgi:hypothetical protein
LLEFASGIAIDGSNNAFVTGSTTSTDFPVVGGNLNINAGEEAFVAILNATGSALTYSTYLGAYASDHGSAIAVDTHGNAYLTGSAGPAFPTTVGAFQSTYPGAFPGGLPNSVAFVVRIGESSGRFWVLVAAVALLVLGAGSVLMLRRRRSPITSADA